MIRAIEELLIREWEAFGMPYPPPKRLNFIQICSTWLQDSGRVVFLAFKPGVGSPCLVARIIRSEGHKVILTEEHTNLVSIHARNPALFDSVPYPVYCGVVDGKTVRIETALQGIPLSTLVRHHTGKDRQKIVMKAYADLGEWLYLFGKPFHRMGPISHDGKLMYRINRSIDEFSDQFEMESVEKDYLRWLRTHIKHYQGPELRTIPNHGDLAAGAVLVTSNGVCVIDWEYYRLDGWPLFDQFMAVIQTGFSIGSPRKKLSLLEQFKVSFTSNWFSDMARKWLSVSCSQLGLPKSILTIWLPIFLIEMSNNRDHTHQASTRRVEGSWRELLLYYIRNSDRCYLMDGATRSRENSIRPDVF